MDPPERRRKGARSSRNGEATIDHVDRRILAELAKDPRTPIARLAARIGLSRPATAARVRRLESQRVILGWHLLLDPARLGLGYTVLLRVRPGPGRASEIEELARGTAAIVEGYRTTGEEGFFLKLHVGTIPEFEELLSRFQRLGETTATDVLSTVVPPRPPRL